MKYFELEDTKYFDLEDTEYFEPEDIEYYESSLASSDIIPSSPLAGSEKSRPYLDDCYEQSLELKGSFMIDGEGEEAITQRSKKLCQTLLETIQEVPANTLFEKEHFNATVNNLVGWSETKIIQDISRLLVPSAE